MRSWERLTDRKRLTGLRLRDFWRTGSGIRVQNKHSILFCTFFIWSGIIEVEIGSLEAEKE